jgi:type I restriction enzyme R subunit
VFGKHIEASDLTRAVIDGATVYYEPPLLKVELPAAAHADLDGASAEPTTATEEEARQRLKTWWAPVEAIVGADKRVAELAADIVMH